MKAKDIVTPGDYEAKNYNGLHKVRVLRIEKVVEKARGFGNHTVTNTYARVQREGFSDQRYTLGQIVRPWAEAADEHAAAEQLAQEGERIRSRLEHALADLASDVDETARGSIMVRLTREQADRLAELLEKSAP